MFATAGCPAAWLPVTQSTPAITPDVLPEPLHPSTRTAVRLTDLATPWIEPPIVPATWVPCPLQSLVPRPSLIAVKPPPARPPNCECVVRMPVSITYALTPAPVALYVYVVLSGRFR